MFRYLLIFVLALLCCPLLFAHEKVSYTRVEFVSEEAKRCVVAGSQIHLESILLQTKFLVAGAGLKTFTPEEGLSNIKKNIQVSLFTKEKGFDWGDFSFPKDFEFYIESLEEDENEYHGAAISFPGSAPWFKKDYKLKLVLQNEKGESILVLHEGKIKEPRCFVEYLAGGLREKAFGSQDARLNSSLSMIRSVISLEKFSYEAPSEPGKYSLKAEFRNAQDLLLGQGNYYFEVFSKEQKVPSANLFVSVQTAPVMRKGKNSKLVLSLKDGYGQDISLPQQDYIRDITIILKKDSIPTMNDAIVRDFHWMPLPPMIKAKFPIEIPFNDNWLDYFGEGEVFFSFQVTREYTKEESFEVSGTFEISFE